MITTECHYIFTIQYNTFIFSCARSQFDILLFYFSLTQRELTHVSQHFHNIFIFIVYLQCKFILQTYKNWQMLYTFIKFVQCLPFLYKYV